PAIASGDEIPIEERSAEEVIGYGDVIWAPEGVKVAHPAFDVTPADLVTALITDKGIVERPNAAKVRELLAR
ncbi:MAG TPA: hypothetical protein VEA63_02250, partial [Opitutus sp.]|nr:hypothetical protein [Opitutus sp.]